MLLPRKQERLVKGVLAAVAIVVAVHDLNTASALALLTLLIAVLSR